MKKSKILFPTWNGKFELKITETENKIGENVSHLEITEVVLVHYSIANNDYQFDIKFLHVIVPNRSFGQLLYILSRNFTFLKTFNSEISYIEV